MARSVLAIITARGGSKGIPGKNIADLGGKPLIAWTIEAARRAPAISRTIVSTDDEQIAAIARQWGAEVPFIRPPELARDDTPGIAPVLHALQWLKEHEGIETDDVMLLQPTSPLRTAEDIEAAAGLIDQRNGDSVVSVCEVKNHPYWTMKLEPDGRLSSFLDLDLGTMQRNFPRRQDLPPAYAENGAIFLARYAIVVKRQSFYGNHLCGYIMPVSRSLDIDAPHDLRLAQILLQKKAGHERD
jgi:CMP-N,N'-diacetyllegionaminic acid synthase